MSDVWSMNVRDFIATDGESRVHVTTDEDLAVKFDKGEVLEGDNLGTHLRVAMAIGIDGEATDRIDVEPGQFGLREALITARASIDLALDAWEREQGRSE